MNKLLSYIVIWCFIICMITMVFVTILKFGMPEKDSILNLKTLNLLEDICLATGAISAIGLIIQMCIVTKKDIEYIRKHGKERGDL